MQGHELAHCLVTYGDKKNLITRTMAALESIRETVYDLLKGSYEEVLDEMAARIADRVGWQNARGCNRIFLDVQKCASSKIGTHRLKISPRYLKRKYEMV